MNLLIATQKAILANPDSTPERKDRALAALRDIPAKDDPRYADARQVLSEFAPEIKILVAVPCYGAAILAPTVLSLFQASAALRQKNIAHDLRFMPGAEISKIRNNFAAMALSENFTHLLFVDADSEFTPDCVMDMVASDKEIIGAAFCAKAIDWLKVSHAAKGGTPPQLLPEIAAPVLIPRVLSKDATTPLQAEAGAQLPVLEGELIEVPWVGTGLALINTTVFSRIAEAFPELEYKEFTAPNRKFFDFFGNEIHPQTRLRFSEDVSFCYRASTLNIPSFMLTKHRTVHHGLFSYVWNPVRLSERR